MAGAQGLRLLYLNPDLISQCNVRTIPDAINVLQTWGMDLPSDYPPPPADFSADGYLILNRNRMDVSGINRAVRDARAAEGLGTRSCKYLPTIVRTMRAVSSNAFEFRNSNIVSMDILQPGDRVKIVASNALRAPEIIFTQVTDVTSTNRFSVSNMPSFALSSNITYTLVGPEIADAKRVALIDAARKQQLTSNASVYPPDDIRIFNSYLYKILYPETQAMTSEEAYLDYLDHLTSCNLRIRTGDDIIAAYVPVSEINIKQQLKLFEGAKFVWDDFVVDNMTAEIGERPTLSNRYHQSRTIITELGIKGYIEEYLHSGISTIAVGSVAVSNCWASNLTFGTATGDALTFGTASGNALTFGTASGDTLTFGTATGDMLTCSSQVKIGDAILTPNHTACNISIMGVDTVTCTGSVTARNFKSLSDARLKCAIEMDGPLQRQADVEKLMQLQVVTYDFFLDHQDKKRHKGILAQEVQQLFPDAVEEILRPRIVTANVLSSRRLEIPTPAPLPIESCHIQGQQYGICKHVEGLIELDANMAGGLATLKAPIEVTLYERTKVVDYEYLTMAMLNALKQCMDELTRLKHGMMP